MRYLTVEEVIYLHECLIERTGGSTGIRDQNLLEAATFRPQVTFGGTELYQTLFDKAAALMHSLVKNHPFVDGNKRIGISAAAMMLLLNGYELRCSQQEMVDFTLSVASGNLEISEISEWLQNHSMLLL